MTKEEREIQQHLQPAETCVSVCPNKAALALHLTSSSDLCSFSRPVRASAPSAALSSGGLEQTFAPKLYLINALKMIPILFRFRDDVENVGWKTWKVHVGRDLERTWWGH